MIGAATNCSISVTEATLGLKFLIATTGCGEGTVQLLMNTNSYSDALGNNGPAIVSASAVTTKMAQPAPTPPSVATPNEPQATTAPPAQTAPALTAEPPAGPGLPVEASEEPVAKAYAFTPSLQEDLEPLTQAQRQDSRYEPQITIQNPTTAKPLVASNTNWISYVVMVLGALVISVVTVSAIRAIRSLRTRRLVRKFS